MCSSGICRAQHLALLVCVRLYFPGAGTEWINLQSCWQNPLAGFSVGNQLEKNTTCCLCQLSFAYVLEEAWSLCKLGSENTEPGSDFFFFLLGDVC